MPTSIKGLLPEVPTGRWKAEKIGQDGDVDERSFRSFHVIDAADAQEAELRLLAYINNDYEDDLRHAEFTADEAPVSPGRWRVTVVWDNRGE